MATYHEIPKPPRPKGIEAEYRTQMYNYLNKLVEQLQTIINGMTAEEKGVKRDGV